VYKIRIKYPIQKFTLIHKQLLLISPNF